MNKFCFIILHFKDSDMTNQCLESIFATAEAGDEIILVDNSHDFDVADITEFDKEINFRVVLPPELNPGFARGMNFGVSQARPSEYLSFINNDTIFPPEFRSEMLRSFKIGGEKLAAVAPKIVYAQQPDIIQLTGLGTSFWRISGSSLHRGMKSSEITGQLSRKRLSGCVLTIRSEIFDRLNGWPDAYFFACEDAELSIRLKKEGYDLSVNADVAVRHFADIGTGRGASHTKEDILVIMNAYANHLLLEKRTSNVMRLAFYKLYLSIFMIFVMPIKWNNIGGQTRLWQKIKLAALIRHEIFTRDMDRIEQFILREMVQTVWLKFNISPK